MGNAIAIFSIIAFLVIFNSLMAYIGISTNSTDIDMPVLTKPTFLGYVSWGISMAGYFIEILAYSFVGMPIFIIIFLAVIDLTGIFIIVGLVRGGGS